MACDEDCFNCVFEDCVVDVVKKKKVPSEKSRQNRALYRKKYYSLNRERLLEYNRNYLKENKEKIAEYKRLYKLRNKERIAEYNQLYYEKN